MMVGKSYIPCLRWKQGEYLAIEHLSSTVRNLIIPLFEVSEIGFDFETGKDNKSIDEHLTPFAKKVKTKWGTFECFIDLRHINATERMMNGEDPISFVFNDLRSKYVNAIPVIGIGYASCYRNAIYDAIKLDKRGLCIRASLDEATAPNFIENLEKLNNEMHLSSQYCDFILDLGAPNFEPITGFASLIESIIKDLPYLNSWRSFGIIGTSFPSSLSGIASGVTFLPRNEWLLYKELIQNLKKSGIRIPTFGDYVINHPEISNVDMRIMKPKANIRYALKDKWLIARGENVRDYGYGQHRHLCKLVAADRRFYGPSFSDADAYINACAQGLAKTGNLTTWRWVGTNHHLEVVGRDAANLVAS